ncbi:hypothetical protein A3860_16910 [Niastella vici]|uniref:BioF2-like acetyltransferase domain-containing protein n=1 Tax=Niastella vici TaxID=1703345 RepID=A0A1V9G436_9BACT|nr:hypothetical protein [Niastella vici]OQP65347.1 hypothetical protein A3860_16910 [Niastella vici]
MGRHQIQYLHRNQIDTGKWDQCIDNAANGLIYARTFYLDCLTDDWDALVLGDYEAVMPLTWRKKIGIRYLYQPAFTQQLGIFTHVVITEELVIAFLKEVEARFRFAEIFLNYAHGVKALPACANFVLSFQRSYEQLQQNYKPGLVKSLKRCRRFNLTYCEEAGHKMVLHAYKEMYGGRMPHVSNEDYINFETLCTFLPNESRVVRVVKENNQLLSAALMLRYKNRLYLLVSVTWPEGRSRDAYHFLLDRVIHEFAESELTLDFEGSELPGVAHFYRSFGTIDQPYFFYHYNRLPWPLRLLKKQARGQQPSL